MKKNLMNLMALGLILILQVSCASKQPIPNDPCQVRLKGRFDMLDRDIRFKGNIARYQEGMASCTFVFWGCRYTETTIDNDNNIFVHGSGLFETKKLVAKLKGNKIEFFPGVLDSFAKIDDMRVSKDNKKVYAKITSSIAGSIVVKDNATSKEAVSYNNKCSLKEAAIGALTLINAKTAHI